MPERLSKIDPHILNPCYRHGTNSVFYGVFSVDDLADATNDPLWKYSDCTLPYEKNPICYMSLSSTISEYHTKHKKNPTRMWNRINIIKHDSDFFTPLLGIDECYTWIALCKQYGLLPEYISEGSVKENSTDDKYISTYDTGKVVYKGTILLDIENIPPSLLYVYLTSYRNMREDPGFVRSVIHLTRDIGINFYLAYVFATVIAIRTYGHHILALSRKYGAENGLYKNDSNNKTVTLNEGAVIAYIQNVSAPLNRAISIRRFINNPTEYDKRHMPSRFECSQTIEKISKIDYQVSFNELLDNKIVDAIMSKTDKKAEKILTNKSRSKGASN